MNYEVKGSVTVPRFIGMQEYLKSLAWNLGIRIDIEIDHRMIFKTIRYRIIGELPHLKLFEKILDNYFECSTSYVTSNTGLSGDRPAERPESSEPQNSSEP